MTAISTIRLARRVRSPARPLASRPSAPRIDVSGVRSSWLTVDTKSFFNRSSSCFSVMSRKVTTTPMRPSSVSMAAEVYSTGIVAPVRERKRSLLMARRGGSACVPQTVHSSAGPASATGDA